MQPKHNVHGIMTDTTKAPTLLYVNLRTSVEFNNTHPFSMEQTLPVNGISVVMTCSPVEGGAITVVWLCAILFLTRLVKLSTAFVYNISKCYLSECRLVRGIKQYSPLPIRKRFAQLHILRCNFLDYCYWRQKMAPTVKLVLEVGCGYVTAYFLRKFVWQR